MRAASALLFLLGAMAIAAPGAASRSGRQTLVVVVSGAGRVVSSPAGIACSRTCSARFASGTRVRLTPRARKGAHFVRWGGACSGRAACAVRLSAARLVTARFAGGAVRTRPKQTAAGRPVAEPGSYSGANPQNGYGFTFSVSPGGRSLVNVSIPYVKIACVPPLSGAPSLDHLGIARGTVRADGSFTATGSQSGVFAGLPARFTYSFTGSFQGLNTAGRATAAGSFREDIAFADGGGTRHTCTSNDQFWSATRAS
jgi:hypothetical protein